MELPSVRLSVCLSVRLSVCLSVRASNHSVAGSTSNNGKVCCYGLWCCGSCRDRQTDGRTDTEPFHRSCCIVSEQYGVNKAPHFTYCYYYTRLAALFPGLPG